MIKLIKATNADVQSEHSIDEDVITNHFNSTQRVILNIDGLDDEVLAGVAQIEDRIETFLAKGSGWVVDSIIHLDLHIARYQALCGSGSGFSFQDLPDQLKKKKCIVNVVNLNDNKCFLWSLLAGIYKSKRNPNLVSKYKKYEKHLNITGIIYPFELSSVKKVEFQNSININVFSYENETVFPLRISKFQNEDKTVNLMYIENHFSCITNLDRLLGG